MARSKKRSFARRRRFKRTGDWVYRTDYYDNTGALIDALGSYKLEEDPLTGGEVNAVAQVLYDSHNRLKQWIDIPSNIPRVMSNAARAEGQRAWIHRVQGIVFIRPSTWTIGSSFRMGMRFGIFEQDPVAGGLTLDPLYTLWGTGTDVNSNPAHWANDRMWQHERRFAMTFSDNAQVWAQRFNFRVNRRLNPNQCYGVYISSVSGSATLNIQPWLRTFVSDEG